MSRVTAVETGIAKRGSDDLFHQEYMKMALQQAEEAMPSPTAFCVGCVIVIPDLAFSSSRFTENQDVLASAYSREFAGNTHAEANALTKARKLGQILVTRGGVETAVSVDELLSNADVYTTMEPCSVRTSGLPACADALIQAGIKRCFIGVAEPPDFVNCEGANKLRAAGVEVVFVPGLEDDCLEVARRGHRS